MQKGLQNIPYHSKPMANPSDKLDEQYPRENQETKKEIGVFLSERPAQWITRGEIVQQFDIDESGVSRHIDDLYDDEFIQSTKEGGERHVQWKGRGVGGFEYWLRQLIPSQMWAAGNELRPLLTLDRLGGAYIPTILFGILFIVGIVTGLLTLVVTNLPSDSAFGITTSDLIIITGAITTFASFFLVLAVVFGVLEKLFQRLYHWLFALIR